MTNEEIESLIAQRIQAKKSGNHAEIDRVDRDLSAAGILINELPSGIIWSRP